MRRSGGEEPEQHSDSDWVHCESPCRAELGLGLPARLTLELVQVRDHDAPPVHLDQAFGLQTAQVAPYQFAHGSDLRGKLMVVDGQRERDALR